MHCLRRTAASSDKMMRAIARGTAVDALVLGTAKPQPAQPRSLCTPLTSQRTVHHTCCACLSRADAQPASPSAAHASVQDSRPPGIQEDEAPATSTPANPTLNAARTSINSPAIDSAQGPPRARSNTPPPAGSGDSDGVHLRQPRTRPSSASNTPPHANQRATHRAQPSAAVHTRPQRVHFARTAGRSQSVVDLRAARRPSPWAISGLGASDFASPRPTCCADGRSRRMQSFSSGIRPASLEDVERGDLTWRANGTEREV